MGMMTRKLKVQEKEQPAGPGTRSSALHARLPRPAAGGQSVVQGGGSLPSGRRRESANECMIRATTSHPLSQINK